MSDYANVDALGPDDDDDRTHPKVCEKKLRFDVEQSERLLKNRTPVPPIEAEEATIQQINDLISKCAPRGQLDESKADILADPKPEGIVKTKKEEMDRVKKKKAKVKKE